MGMKEKFDAFYTSALDGDKQWMKIILTLTENQCHSQWSSSSMLAIGLQDSQVHTQLRTMDF
jgi:hypothetical protein